MEGFKQFVAQNPPIVRSVEHDLIRELKMLKTAVNDAVKFIEKMLGELQLEAARHVKADVDDYVMPSPQFLQYMLENFKAKPIRSSGLYNTYKTACGEDGCAYFMTNKIVVKFSEDAKEMNIAERVAGILSRIPIIAAFEVEIVQKESIIYAIVMRELSSLKDLRYGYYEAARLFTNALDTLTDVIYKKPETSVDYIRRRLSIGYIIRSEGTIHPDTRSYLEDLVRAIRAVYARSGYLLGTDWSPRNLGATSKDRLQPFDFGRATEHPVATINAKKIERKTLVIPARG